MLQKMWVVKTRHSGTLFAGRVADYPQRPCVVVFETKKQAVQMRHMINMMRLVPPTQRPHQPLNVEKWSLSSILNICNTNALDVVVMKDGDKEPDHYPANRTYSEDVRFTLDCLYMYGGTN